MMPRAEDVAGLQAMCGLPPANCTGKWDARSVVALAIWQKKVRYSGKLGLAREEFLDHALSLDYLGSPTPAQPLPIITPCAAGTYDHASPPGENCGAWPVMDTQLEEMTSTGSWLASMIRLVSGRKVSHSGRVSYSRGLDSYVSLDTGSFGIAHWWVGTIQKQLLKPFAERLPLSLIEEAWGVGAKDILLDADRMEHILGERRGAQPYCAPRMGWLLAGWWHIARNHLAAALQLEAWTKSYVGEALEVAREFDISTKGRSGGLLLAAIARMCNSGPSSCREILRKHWRPGKGEGADVANMRDIFHMDREEGGYSKRGNGPRRWATIEQTCKVAVPQSLLERDFGAAIAGSLRLGVAPARAIGVGR